MENNAQKPLKVAGSRTLYATEDDAAKAMAKMIAKAIIEEQELKLAEADIEAEANANRIAMDSMSDIQAEVDAQSEPLPTMASNATIDEMIKAGYYRDLFAAKPAQEKSVSDSQDSKYRSGTGFGVFKDK